MLLSRYICIYCSTLVQHRSRRHDNIIPEKNTGMRGPREGAGSTQIQLDRVTLWLELPLEGQPFPKVIIAEVDLVDEAGGNVGTDMGPG